MRARKQQCRRAGSCLQLQVTKIAHESLIVDLVRFTSIETLGGLSFLPCFNDNSEDI